MLWPTHRLWGFHSTGACFSLPVSCPSRAPGMAVVPRKRVRRVGHGEVTGWGGAWRTRDAFVSPPLPNPYQTGTIIYPVELMRLRLKGSGITPRYVTQALNSQAQIQKPSGYDPDPSEAPSLLPVPSK